MKSFFDKLTPAERRLVVLVGIALFVVINIWWIIPRFGEYGKFEKEREKALKLIGTYNAEIARKGSYEKQINELTKLGGQIASQDAALKLVDEVNTHVALCGINVNNITPMNRGSSGGKTNFFEEASVQVSYNAGEKELIDFLYRLADKEYLIRAKSLTIQPDVPGRTRLQGNLTLVKSYQKKPPPKAAPTVPSRTGPATNTTTRPAPKSTPAPKTGPASTNAPAVAPKK